MVVIAGFARKRHPVNAIQVACPLCHRESVRVGIVEKRAFDVFWIPIIPLGSSKKYVCLLCGGEEKVKSLEAAPNLEVPPAEVRVRLADLIARQSAPTTGPPPPPPRPVQSPPP